MIKKLIISFLSIILIIGSVFAIFTLVYFVVPSRNAEAGIHLPAQVADDISSSESTTESTANDNIYIADVHQSLTLRTEPDSNSAAATAEGLAPMTHMQVIRFIDGSNFAYVKVLNGQYEGKTGYVNSDYITKLGESMIRIGTEE